MNFWRPVVFAIIYAATIAVIWLGVAQAGAAALLGNQFADSHLGAVLVDSRDVPPGYGSTRHNRDLMTMRLSRLVGFRYLRDSYPSLVMTV